MIFLVLNKFIFSFLGQWLEGHGLCFTFFIMILHGHDVDSL